MQDKKLKLAITTTIFSLCAVMGTVKTNAASKSINNANVGRGFSKNITSLGKGLRNLGKSILNNKSFATLGGSGASNSYKSMSSSPASGSYNNDSNRSPSLPRHKPPTPPTKIEGPVYAQLNFKNKSNSNSSKNVLDGNGKVEYTTVKNTSGNTKSLTSKVKSGFKPPVPPKPKVKNEAKPPVPPKPKVKITKNGDGSITVSR